MSAGGQRSIPSPEGGPATNAWDRFWFAPQSTASLALMRIVFGLLVLASTLSLGGQLSPFFSRDGLLPSQPGGSGVWGVLGWFPSDTAVQLLYAVLLVACLALIVGYHSRLASFLVFVGTLSFTRRDPFIFDTGDYLVHMMALYLMFTPSGAALSVDRWRHSRERFWEFPVRPLWGMRLMQVQLSIIYVFAVWAKVQGVDWNDGTAVSYAMRIVDVSRFAPPSFVTHSVVISNLMTYGTLVVEASMGILIWNRRLRKWVMLAGGLLHLGIDLGVRIGFFSETMWTLYISFLEPQWAERRILALRDRWRRARAPAPRAAAAAAHARHAQASPRIVEDPRGAPAGASRRDPV